LLLAPQLSGLGRMGGFTDRLVLTYTPGRRDAGGVSSIDSLVLRGLNRVLLGRGNLALSPALPSMQVNGITLGDRRPSDPPVAEWQRIAETLPASSFAAGEPTRAFLEAAAGFLATAIAEFETVSRHAGTSETTDQLAALRQAEARFLDLRGTLAPVLSSASTALALGPRHQLDAASLTILDRSLIHVFLRLAPAATVPVTRSTALGERGVSAASARSNTAVSTSSLTGQFRAALDFLSSDQSTQGMLFARDATSVLIGAGAGAAAISTGVGMPLSAYAASMASAQALLTTSVAISFLGVGARVLRSAAFGSGDAFRDSLAFLQTVWDPRSSALLSSVIQGNSPAGAAVDALQATVNVAQPFFTIRSSDNRTSAQRTADMIGGQPGATPDPQPPDPGAGLVTVAPAQLSATVGIGLTDGVASFTINNPSNDTVAVTVISSSDKVRVSSPEQLSPRGSAVVTTSAPWDAFQAEGEESVDITIEARRQRPDGTLDDARQSLTVSLNLTVHAPRLAVKGGSIVETVPKGPVALFEVTVANEGHTSTGLTFALADDGSSAEFVRDSIRTDTLQGGDFTMITIRVPTDAPSWLDGDTRAFQPSVRIDRPTLAPSPPAVPIDMRITVTEELPITGVFIGGARGRVQVIPSDRPTELSFPAEITVMLRIDSSMKQVSSEGSRGLIVSGAVTASLGSRTLDQVPFTAGWMLDDRGRNPTGSVLAARGFTSIANPAGEVANLGRVIWNEDLSAISLPEIAQITIVDEDGTQTSLVLPFGPLTLART